MRNSCFSTLGLVGRPLLQVLDSSDKSPMSQSAGNMSLLPSSPTVKTRFRCGYSEFFIKLTEPARAGFQCNFAQFGGVCQVLCSSAKFDEVR